MDIGRRRFIVQKQSQRPNVATVTAIMLLGPRAVQNNLRLMGDNFNVFVLDISSDTNSPVHH